MVSVIAPLTFAAAWRRLWKGRGDGRMAGIENTRRHDRGQRSDLRAAAAGSSGCEPARNPGGAEPLRGGGAGGGAAGRAAAGGRGEKTRAEKHERAVRQRIERGGR